MAKNKIKPSLNEKSLIDKLAPVLQWILPAFIIFLWVLATNSSDFKLRLLPSPTAVIERTVKMVSDGSIWEYIIISSQRALIGLVIGGALGYFMGMLNGMSKVSNAFLNTTIQMFRTVPVLALLPLLIIYLGIGETLKIFMVALAVFFPMYLNTYGGVRTIDDGLLEMSKVYGLNKWELFTQVILPGSLQSVLVGVRISLGIMWVILIAAEMVGTDAGIGYMATQARELMQMDKVFLAIFIYALLGKLSDLVATLLENRFLRWRHA
ncbi:MAG: ssuC [Oscillospiraceae bacterium]|nr:ssuC [Oscillospiraceae bacterium]